MSDIIVAMHGYKPSADNFDAVVNDRLSRTLEVDKFLEKYGIECEVVISGGVEKDGIKEADIIYQWAKEKMPEIKKYNVVLEKDSKNTFENVQNIYDLAKKEGAKGIFAVSSKDHISRVIRDWVYNIPDYESKDILLAGVPSRDAYSEKGRDNPPFIAEPPFWGYDALRNIFKVPADKREYVKKAIEEVINESLMQ